MRARSKSAAAATRGCRDRTAAGLDSFAVEPLPESHPSHDEARIVLSPRIGGVTADADVPMGIGAAKNVLASLTARRS